jgi:DNA-binding protein HU-beta
MNKQQFAERLSDECELSKAEAARTLDAILDSITEALLARDEISFPGFGKFVTVEQKARDSANPRDRSQLVHVDAKTVPKFRPGSGLKEAVSKIPVPPAARRASERAAATSPDDSREVSTADATDRGSSRQGQPGDPGPADWKPLSQRK